MWCREGCGVGRGVIVGRGQVLRGCMLTSSFVGYFTCN